MPFFMPHHSSIGDADVRVRCPRCGGLSSLNQLGNDQKRYLLDATHYERARVNYGFLKDAKEIADRFPNTKHPLFFGKLGEPGDIRAQAAWKRWKEEHFRSDENTEPGLLLIRARDREKLRELELAIEQEELTRPQPTPEEEATVAELLKVKPALSNFLTNQFFNLNARCEKSEAYLESEANTIARLLVRCNRCTDQYLVLTDEYYELQVEGLTRVPKSEVEDSNQAPL
jgi:phage FluMu protein Com